MSSSQSRSSGGSGGERMIHQDYIARIRYSNALPPPPNPPKLLNIPNQGLTRFTQASFHSRLVRDQPFNIEVDAELGMPLDLVGMPGVFDGDESSIQAPPQAPPIHPRDRDLLRPISTLGKSKASDTSVSFLRRTEYIASSASKPKDNNIFLKPSNSAARNRPEKRKAVPTEPDKGTPAWIKRRIEASFEVARKNLQDPSRVRHPSNPRLKVKSCLPFLPDLESFPDSGAYVTVKFSSAPVSMADAYDTRLTSGILKPMERNAVEQAAWEAAHDAYEQDPVNNPRPSNIMNYHFYLPPDVETGHRFRAKFDVENEQRDLPQLYNSKCPSGPCFRFPRVRAYETIQEKEMDHDTKYAEEIILAFNDDESDGRPDADNSQAAVYYYPIMQRSTIRNQRSKNIARNIGITDEYEHIVDELEVTVNDPDEELKAELQKFKEQPIGFFPGADEEDEQVRAASPDAEGQEVIGHDDDDEDQDADGERD
ncbi:RNA polymerase II-associated protein 1 [Rhypophila sp. PSN 637]